MAKKENKPDDEKFPGYPQYPASEDIYNKEEKEPLKEDEEFAKEEQKKQDKIAGNDLDVPGSELDDKDEDIGEEDEENNYYSLGGDNHENLEEDQA
ncbi:MAG: hypothetical protein WDN26_03865 [Chitinophagaceae bacterium]